MNPNDTIKTMLFGYPRLFQSKEQCLIHLFCIIGNGYSWVNGELIDPSDLKVILTDFPAGQLSKLTSYEKKAGWPIHNPIHEAYLMVGFLNNRSVTDWSVFGAYTRLISCNAGSPYANWHYLKALKVLHTQPTPGVINETA